MPMDAVLPDEEKLARLQLVRGRGIGPASFKALIEAHGDAVTAVRAILDCNGKANRRFQPAERAVAETEIEKAARFGARIVFHGEADYPPALALLAPPPPVLTVMGDATLPMRRALAIVGARNASLAGSRLAQAMGRPVMAVPGSPLDARAEGPNYLIRQGATLIRDGADLAEALGLDAGLLPGLSSAIGVEGPEAAEDRIVVDALGTAPVTVDELVAHTGSSARRIQQLLMELDLAGRLQRHAGGRVSLYR